MCSLWRPTLGLSIADELHMVYECPALQPLRQRYAHLFPTQTDTMRCLFAQNDHMQITSKFILHCVDFLNICSCFLSSVIRLVGWLKHCTLSANSFSAFVTHYLRHAWQCIICLTATYICKASSFHTYVMRADPDDVSSFADQCSSESRSSDSHP